MMLARRRGGQDDGRSCEPDRAQGRGAAVEKCGTEPLSEKMRTAVERGSARVALCCVCVQRDTNGTMQSFTPHDDSYV